MCSRACDLPLYIIRNVANGICCFDYCLEYPHVHEFEPTNRLFTVRSATASLA